MANKHVYKLLLVTPYFYPSVGGLENYAYQIAQQLIQLGWEVIVVTSSDRSRSTHAETLHGIKVYRLPTLIQVSNTPINILWPIYIWRIIRREKPDIINAHTPVPGMVDSAAMVHGRIPFFVTYHAATLYKTHATVFNILIAIYRFFERATLRSAKHIISVTPYYKDSLTSASKHKRVVIENAVESKAIRKIMARKVSSSIVFIANLNAAHSWKGLELVIAALSEINKKTGIAPHTLTVIGDGDYTWYYKDLVHTLRLDDSVIFLGQVEGERKFEIIAKSEICVCYPSGEQDAFPTVILEGWASKTAVVCADIGALSSIIHDGEDGLLADPNDSAALATTILKLSADKDLQSRIVEGASRRITGLTWESSGRKTNTLFREYV